MQLRIYKSLPKLLLLFLPFYIVVEAQDKKSAIVTCLEKSSLREESKNKCEEDRQQYIESDRIYDQKLQNRIDEIRQKIRELEPNPDTNQNR